MQVSSRPKPTPEQCARVLLDSLPPILWFMRSKMRCHPTAGISVAQFRALLTLGRLTDPTLSEVSIKLGCSLPTTSRLIAGLCRRGLITRGRKGTDRRKATLALNARGRRVLATARRSVEQDAGSVLEKLSSKERRIIIEMISRLGKMFEQSTPYSAQTCG